MIPPGSTIGILGGGQLGRMLALAARPLGYRVVVLGPDVTPTRPVADQAIEARFDDNAALKAFIEAVDVATIEFEQIPSTTLAFLEKHIPVHPKSSVLEITRDRYLEKTTLEGLGVPIAPWQRINSSSELHEAARVFEARGAFPALLKTSTLGYDGKGQIQVERAADLTAAWQKLQESPCVLESMITFSLEASIILARSSNGEERAFPIIENKHRNGILDLSVWPAAIEPTLARQAEQIAQTIAQSLDVRGLLTVELFITPNGVLVNELAPRPHNSGHLTIEGAQISQFEQLIRAITGLPLGEIHPRPAAMANLLGEAWLDGQPDWTAALAHGAKLHLYGKNDPQRGRKMGHLTSLGLSRDDALEHVLTARRALQHMV